MVYNCKRCTISCNSIGRLIAHLNRKNPCKITNEDIDVSEYLEQILASEKHKRDDFQYICKFCLKKFAQRSYISHHESICILKKHHALMSPSLVDYEQRINLLQQKSGKYEKKIQQFQERIGALQKSLHNKTEESSKVNNYGEEDYDRIPASDMIDFFLWADVFECIKCLHFDPAEPKNHNIRYFDGILKKFDQGKWVKGEIFDILEDNIRLLQQVPYKYKPEMERRADPSLEEYASTEEFEESIRDLDKLMENIKEKSQCGMFCKLENFLGELKLNNQNIGS